MKSVVTDCDLRLYADGPCLLFSNENVSSIKKHLMVDFNSPCEWFTDNKLSIYLGEDKCILFKERNSKNENKIKQYSAVEYLGCLLDERMSGESMAKRALIKLKEK